MNKRARPRRALAKVYVEMHLPSESRQASTQRGSHSIPWSLLASLLVVQSLSACVSGAADDAAQNTSTASGATSGAHANGGTGSLGLGSATQGGSQATTGGSGNSGAGTGNTGAGSAGQAATAGSGSGGVSGGTPPGSAGAGPTFPPADRGATLNYLEYEAEDSDTNGAELGPSRKTSGSNDVAAESSQRKAVKLSNAGQYVRVKSKQHANSIVVRLSVPDSADGQGQWYTLSVYVDGVFRQKLNVTSRWSWTYGTTISPSSNNPADGNPHHYYDEAHAIIGDIPQGATVSVQKDGDDSAAYYVVDLIDLEFVAGPIAQPTGSISVTDCGATPNDDSDDQAALQTCIDRARDQRKILYLPAGKFNSFAKELNVDSVTIQGAGMWYSQVFGINAGFVCYGNNCKYSDFAVAGDTIGRDDTKSTPAFLGPSGTGTSLNDIWVEHSNTGYWVGPNASGLSIKNCRFRDLYADGVNFYGGTNNSTVEQSHFRNTGDDSMASWSAGDKPSNGNNTFKFNTVQTPWLANCFGVYGGNDTKIEDNVCSDTVQFPGILIAQQFDSHPFGGTTSIQRNSLIRDGGFDYDDGQGALKFYAAQGDISGFLVKDLQITDSTYCGVQIWGGGAITNLTLDTVNISGSGSSGIQVNYNARGSALATGVVVSNGGLDDTSKGGFGFNRQAGNSGW